MPKAASRSTTSTTTKKAKTSKKKDPNAPKRPLSAYMLWTTDNRERVRQENPDAKFPDIGRILGSEWKDLSEEDKESYKEKAAQEKKKYEEKMKNYNAGGGHAGDDDADEDDE